MRSWREELQRLPRLPVWTEVAKSLISSEDQEMAGRRQNGHHYGTENEDEEAWMGAYNLLTQKPVIYAAMLQKTILQMMVLTMHVQAVRKYAAEQNSEIFVICAQIEEEISELDEDERKMFLEDLDSMNQGLEKLVKALSSPRLMSFPDLRRR